MNWLQKKCQISRFYLESHSPTSYAGECARGMGSLPCCFRSSDFFEWKSLFALQFLSVPFSTFGRIWDLSIPHYFFFLFGFLVESVILMVDAPLVVGPSFLFLVTNRRNNSRSQYSILVVVRLNIYRSLKKILWFVVAGYQCQAHSWAWMLLLLIYVSSYLIFLFRVVTWPVVADLSSKTSSRSGEYFRTKDL